ncbi:MAG TPA: ABC transporter permease [Vicinamibacterales bacterium]|nr:ABC transporter permease [Vicinamibacterales bacterium]
MAKVFHERIEGVRDMKRSLRSWLWRVPLDQEFDEEIALHIEMRTRELIADGMDPNDARAAAIMKMGDVASLRRACVDLGRKRDREMRVTMWLEELRDDIRFAFRQLRAAPAFTLVATLTLALGIGANSAIFALVDATLLRPLPYHSPDRLVTIWETTDKSQRGLASPPDMLDWKSRSRTFETIAGFAPNVGGMVMEGRDGNAENVSRQWVTSGIFDVLGVQTIAGRTFLPEDEQQRMRVVVISESFWETRFNRDASVIGSEVKFDGTLWRIVGVVPKNFEILGRTSMWAMQPFPAKMPPRARASYQLQVVGRMKPGIGIEAAQSDLSAVADGLAAEFAEFNKGRGVRLEPMHDTIIGSDLKTTSMMFLGVVGFVLLISCANVANLLLARATARTRELAVRSALGAGRMRIVRQLLTESIVLAAIGGIIGIGVGAAILRVAPTLIPEGLLPATVQLAFDMRVVAFCAASALIVGVLFGVAPAWQATSFSSREVMGSDSRTTTGGGGKLRNALVMGEVATAVLLLFGAGLLLRTLVAVESYDRGYRANNVLTLMLDPLSSSYPTPEKLQHFFDQVDAEIRAVPGVQDVAYSSALPMGSSLYGDFALSYQIVGDPPVQPSLRPATHYQVVSASYFSALDLPIVAGRGFDRRDTADSPRVCIVNEAFVKTLGGRNPIGMQVSFNVVDSPSDKPNVGEIVGVARQVKGRPDEPNDFVQIYVPQAHDLLDDVFLIVRAKSGRATALTPAIRAAISRIDREKLVNVQDITTLEDIEWSATGRHRFRAAMVTAFATLAVMLAMVGVFGILAYSVQQRVRDFGVRRALGATTGDVMRLVVGSAVKVIVAGAVIGLVLAAAFGRLISTMLFGVQPLDLPTFALVTVVLGMTAAVSIAGPAWRAARIDPAQALRTR